MKQLFRLLGVAAVVATSLAVLNLTNSTAQNSADPFVAQFTNYCSNAFAGGISGNGRFVVVESDGDLATGPEPRPRNNIDGSREIFLVDYAQRRVFQITNGKNSVRPTPTPSPTATATPTATPTPTPTPTPNPSATPTPTPLPPFPTPPPTPACVPSTQDFTAGLAVTNLRPIISHDGRWIIFSSNSPTSPDNFDLTVTANYNAMLADGNQEIWRYEIPLVSNPNADLSSGVEQPFNNLSGGTFTRITNSTPSRRIRPNVSPIDIVDDNREPAINDDASVIAFVSVRNLVPLPSASPSPTPPLDNSDLNAEIFVYTCNSTSMTTPCSAMAQVTKTVTTNIVNPIFNTNPSMSGNSVSGTTKLAWLSNANIAIGGSSNNADLNAEVYTGTYNNGVSAVTQQLTRTTAGAPGISVNLLAPGRRMSRDGTFLAFESSSNAPRASGTPQAAAGLYLVNISDVANPTFTEIGPRATSGGDLQRFPTFTGDNTTLVWTSGLNFNADGTAPSPSPSASPTTNTGLNPRFVAQLFTIPVAAPSPFSARKLTETPTLAAIQHFVSNTTQRIAFNIGGANFGTGDNSGASQVYYLRPSFATEPSPSPGVSFFTGAANRMLVDALATPTATPSPTATATPTPTPTPTGSPSPTPVPPVTTATPVFGLQPGMIGKIRAGVPLAPSAQEFGPGGGGQLSFFPLELNGVSVSIGNASAGLIFVSPSEIQFQVPEGLASALTGAGLNTANANIVVNNNGTAIRSVMRLVNNAQPDIFPDPARPGRAIVLNITKTTMGLGTTEPFNVTSVDGLGRSVPTVLAVFVTGVLNTSPGALTVRVGTTDISGTDNILFVNNTGFPGIQEVWFRLPASLAGAGDVPIFVYLTGTVNGGTFSSAPEDGNPTRIRIN